MQRLPDKRYVPGPALLALGLRSLRRLPADRFNDAVQTLVDLTGESVSVGILLGEEITLVARRESAHALRYVASVGDVIAPHRSAMGKVVLAYAAPERSDRILREAVGDDADAVRAGLADQLAETLATGIGRDEESFAVGLRCVAAPVLGGDGYAVGAVSISGPSARFTRELADGFLPALREQARRLSQLPTPVGAVTDLASTAEELHARARRLVPAGTHSNSRLRAPRPLYVERAEGATSSTSTGPATSTASWATAP